jgi:urease accessory protein
MELNQPVLHHEHQEHQQAPAGWRAQLDLRFRKSEEHTVLAGRRHMGPLRVQKALYPEGPDPCHVIVLHPPAGIVGGDELALDLQLEPGSQVCVTTPGAAKWYRSAGATARQHVDIALAEHCVLEWLPQETLIFDGAMAQLRTQVRLHDTARYFGWEVLCLGRRASGESFVHGMLELETRIETQGGPLWFERGRIAGADPLLHSPVGLAGRPVCATLLMAGVAPNASLLDSCRAIALQETTALAGLSWMPQLLVGRYLGHSAEAARAWLFAVWQQLRPQFAGRAAQPPRIWKT